MNTVAKLIEMALEEDLGSGDVTTDNLIPPELSASGQIVAKEKLVLAGCDVARRVFERLDAGIAWQPHQADGDSVDAGEVVVTVSGNLRALLTGERTALNFLQRLSGIATLTRAYSHKIPAEGARLVDTRKTTPGWRVLEKYAVRIGGGGNHRMGLYDGILIKDNHIVACGGVAAAVTRIRRRVSHLLKIEVEAATLDDVRDALSVGVEVIMLDNMDIDQIRKAVAMIAGRAAIEVSGNITAERLAQLARTGIDIISVGALTHSAQCVDMSMRITGSGGRPFRGGSK
jgi:nicotinate-nucleotide pyrophosphorylase (carboxylating)